MTKKCLNPSDAYCLPALSTTTTPMANSSQNFESKQFFLNFKMSLFPILFFFVKKIVIKNAQV
jgi:hypothetical protein